MSKFSLNFNLTSTISINLFIPLTIFLMNTLSYINLQRLEYLSPIGAKVDVLQIVVVMITISYAGLSKFYIDTQKL